MDSALCAGGIVHGLKPDQLMVAIMALDYPDQLAIGQSFLIAEGTTPEPGQDGFIEYHTDVSGIRTRREMTLGADDGRVDYKAMTEIPTVEAGQLLATIHPPAPGKSGIGLNGVEFTADDNGPADIVAGDGVEVGPDGQQLYATRPGRAVLSGETLIVFDVYEVDGDVDMTVGNIVFDGHVVVNGNVLDEFEIRCKSLEVHGTVGASIVECSGDATLSGGVNGNQKGRLVIGGVCTVKYLNEVKAAIEGDLIVERGVTNSIIECGSSVVAERIVGGRATALHGFEVNYLGSDLGVATQITPGVHYKLVSMEHELEQLSRELDSLESGARSPADGSTTSSTNELQQAQSVHLVSDTLDKAEALRSRVGSMLAERDRLRHRQDQNAIPIVNVGLQCHADVIVRIGLLSKEFATSRSGKMSIAINNELGEIEAGPYARRRLTKQSRRNR